MTTPHYLPPPLPTLALELLEPFSQHILPGTVRRIAAWRHLPRSTSLDHLQELRQELALDCLEHPQEIVELPAIERHRRWMRIADRWIHAQLRQVSRRRGLDPDEVAAHDQPIAEDLPELPAALRANRLRNGRCNVSEAARVSTSSKHSLHLQLDALATRMGRGKRYVAFWNNRLGEAITGLAADQLILAGAVRVVARRRARPDPRGRINRLRRLQRSVPVWRHAMHLRRALRTVLPGPGVNPPSPRQLLEVAAELCPAAHATWLWLFEARIAEGDVLAAAAALRRARHAAEREATERWHAAHALARCRLREARGDFGGALRALDRACRRWPHQGQLLRVRDALTAR